MLPFSNLFCNTINLCKVLKYYRNPDILEFVTMSTKSISERVWKQGHPVDEVLSQCSCEDSPNVRLLPFKAYQQKNCSIDQFRGSHVVAFFFKYNLQFLEINFPNQIPCHRVTIFTTNIMSPRQNSFENDIFKWGTKF